MDATTPHPRTRLVDDKVTATVTQQSQWAELGVPAWMCDYVASALDKGFFTESDLKFFFAAVTVDGHVAERDAIRAWMDLIHPDRARMW